MTEAGKQKTKERMLRDNPMKKAASRQKSSDSHKGQVAWNRGISTEEYRKHYPNGIKGGRPAGYLHTIESKKKMSEIRTKMLKSGTVKLGKKSPKDIEKSRELMRKNRRDPEFNQKMFSSLTASVTKPHLKIQTILREEGYETKTNMAFLFGRVFGSIDEVIEDKKIAIFIDGNYWHNYPTGRRWDRYCTTFLQNRGWKVIRFWESEINDDIEMCREIIKNIK